MARTLSTCIFDFIQRFEWLVSYSLYPLVKRNAWFLTKNWISKRFSMRRHNEKINIWLSNALLKYFFFGSNSGETKYRKFNLNENKHNVRDNDHIEPFFFLSTIFVMCKHTTISFPFKCVSNDRSDEERKNKRKQHFIFKRVMHVELNTFSVMLIRCVYFIYYSFFLFYFFFFLFFLSFILFNHTHA